MSDAADLCDRLRVFFGDKARCLFVSPISEVTLLINPSDLYEVALALCDEPQFRFQQLVDLCGVDYLLYGMPEWETDSTTTTGFSRGVQAPPLPAVADLAFPPTSRFAVVYHFLSLTHGQRLRMRVFLDENQLELDSLCSVWPSANWYEREAFDLYGIVFRGHPDLRRILTDYGFVGHPFRKDFPLIGRVEMRYDGALGKCVYEPVSIQPRTLVPKVIRHDARYCSELSDSSD